MYPASAGISVVMVSALPQDKQKVTFVFLIVRFGNLGLLVPQSSGYACQTNQFTFCRPDVLDSQQQQIWML